LIVFFTAGASYTEETVMFITSVTIWVPAFKAYSSQSSFILYS
jgi:hypothetical protein